MLQKNIESQKFLKLKIKRLKTLYRNIKIKILINKYNYYRIIYLLKKKMKSMNFKFNFQIKLIFNNNNKSNYMI